MTPEPACMFDHQGRRVERWIPEMQSTTFLRAAIARGERTDECWAVLRANNQRVQAGREVVAGIRKASPSGGGHWNG